MINPCYDYCYIRFGNQYTEDCDNKCEFAKVVKEKKLIEKELDRPIKTLSELATQFCCITECKNCPVVIHNYEKRTEYEKTCLHEPCVSNLYKWILENKESVN
jgi:murein L,D-transpeptidase YafK